MADPKKFHWAAKVGRRDIRRLYESDAKGLLDEELLEQVIETIHTRVLDMFEVRLAQQTGQVTCRNCGAIVEQRLGMGSINRSVPLKCSQCGWETTCGEYLEGYMGKDLLPGSRTALFEEFLERLEGAHTPKEKMLLLDWLIHEFHVHSGVSGRLVAMNVVQGSRDELVELLNELASGSGKTSSQQNWLEKNADPIRQFRLEYPSHVKVLNEAARLGIRKRTQMPEDQLIAEILRRREQEKPAS